MYKLQIPAGFSCHAVVYDYKKNDFITIFEDWTQNKIAFQAITSNIAEPTSFASTIPLKPSYDHWNALQGMWQCIDNRLIRTCPNEDQNSGSTKNTLIIYDINSHVIEFAGFLDDYTESAEHNFDAIKCYDHNSRYEQITSKQIVVKNDFIPEYVILMSQRALKDNIKKATARAYSSMFDPVYMRYIFENHNQVAENSLVIYDLLPYALSAAIRFLPKSKNILLDAWYVWQAQYKTKRWEQLSSEITNKISSEIKQLYPLYVAPPKNISTRTSAMLKRNVGALWARAANTAHYTYLMYGRAIRHAAIVGGATALWAWFWLVYMSSKGSRSGIPITIKNMTDKPITVTDLPSLLKEKPLIWKQP